MVSCCEAWNQEILETTHSAILLSIIFHIYQQSQTPKILNIGLWCHNNLGHIILTWELNKGVDTQSWVHTNELQFLSFWMKTL